MIIRIAPAEDHGLSLDVIQIDGGTQSRATLNQHVVDDYAEAIKAGATFPPIVIFYDGKKHWLADGFHRFHAYRQAGKSKVAADIRQGTRRDAILHSVGANETHGLRRTRDDKRRAVLTLLNDAEWAKWSDGEIAKRCAVSREYVNRLRPKDTCDQVTGMERTFVHPKTGEPVTMKIAKPAVVRENRTTDEHHLNASLSNASEAEIAGESTAPVERIILDEFVALWCEANSDDREGILGYLRINGFIPSSNPEPDDVDRSAERASSAVEVGAPVSPEGAQGSAEVSGVGGGSSAQGKTEPSVGSEYAGTSTDKNPASISPSAAHPVEAVADNPQVPRPSATAPLSNPQPTSSPDVDKAEASTSSPSASAAPFAAMSKADQVRLLRPHCQHPDDLEKCGGSGRTHCHACKKAAAEGEAA